jgi:dUTP pyrophosphatase
MKMALIRDTLPPHRGTGKSAGIDLFVPKITQQYITAFNIENTSPERNAFIDPVRKMICIHPGGKVHIPTGVKMEIPEGSAVVVMNKGGTSWVDRVTKIAELVDQDYQGEIFITLVNYSNDKTTLQENQKLIQLVRVPVFYDEIEIVPVDQIHLQKTERGSGAMGSTGT